NAGTQPSKDEPADTHIRHDPTIREIVADALGQSQTFLLAILAEHADALCDSLPGVGMRSHKRADANVSCANGVKSEEDAQHFGAPCPHESEDAQNLSPV